MAPCCIQYDKDTILKAIYNYRSISSTICWLYSVWQRYNFESNLQLDALFYDIFHGCIQYDKDTILKAIYNLYVSNRITCLAVFSMTKIQFWKQFTTNPMLDSIGLELYSVWQRYNFESNLQLLLHFIDNLLAVFSMTKIQFWKQFTTYDENYFKSERLYSVWQRYNFESNLQRKPTKGIYSMSCIQYDKDTILKAIYNPNMCKVTHHVLYSVWQRYNFESNLQPTRCLTR